MRSRLLCAVLALCAFTLSACSESSDTPAGDPLPQRDGSAPDGEARDAEQDADARPSDAATDAADAVARDATPDSADAGGAADARIDAADAMIDAPIDGDTTDSESPDADAESFDADASNEGTDSGPDAAETGPPPDGTTCAQAIDITAAIAHGGTYSGKALGAAHEQSSCADQTAPAAHLVANLGGGNFRIDVKSHKPASDPSAAKAAVIVRNVDCTYVTMEAICNAHAATQPTQFGTALSGNTYFILQGDYFADGFDLTLTKLSTQCNVDADCHDFPGARCNWLNGACVTAFQCPRGTGDCDRDPTNGCEVDLTSDVRNCGACGGTCLGQHDSTGGSCSSGVCALACAPNKADCNGATYDGCEADLTADSATCGTCSTTCNGATCATGACAAIAENVTTTTAPTTALGVSSTDVYVLSGQPLDYTRSLFTSAKLPSSTAVLLANDAQNFAVAPDGSFVDWVTHYDVKRRVTSTGQLSTLSPSSTAQSPPMHKSIITDGMSDWIFDQQSAYPPATLEYLASGASTLTPILQTQGQLPAELLWTKAGVVLRTSDDAYTSSVGHARFFTLLPFDGSPARQIGTPYSAAVGYAADDDTLWYGGDGLYTVPLAGGAAVKTWTAANATPSSQPYVFAIALDSTNVYFAAIPPFDGWHYRSYIYRMPKSGGAAVPLVDDDIAGQSANGRASGPFIAVDDTYVYWTAGKSVKRVRKL